jgi:exosome complex RNA-binding protein Rrp42 (RNase PH superfamily)
MGDLEVDIQCASGTVVDLEELKEISLFFQKGYSNPSVCNREMLCVSEGEWCWTLFVDVLILDVGGNVYDAISLGINIALQELLVPLAVVVQVDGNQREVVVKDDQYLPPIVVSRDAVPLCITLRTDAKNVAILVADCTSSEERALPLAISVLCSARQIYGLHSQLAAPLPSNLFKEAVSLAMGVSNKLLEQLSISVK